MRTPFNKHLYIKIYTFHENKTADLRYERIDTFKQSFLINPNHVFNSNGYQTILLSDRSAETINPLDFKSQYNVKDFQSAIQSKLIRETFGILDNGKIDIMKVILFINLGVTFLLLYLLLKQGGVL